MVLKYICARFPLPIKKALYKKDIYCRLGALHNDFYANNPLVDEAVRRLPKKEQDERNFRVLRATQMDITHTILPEDQWTPFEANHFYLEPYIEEVKAEEAEKKEWYKTH